MVFMNIFSRLSKGREMRVMQHIWRRKEIHTKLQLGRD